MSDTRRDQMLSNLRTASQTLDEVVDRARARVRHVEEALNEIGVGIEAWVKIDHEEKHLGFVRRRKDQGGGWKLVLYPSLPDGETAPVVENCGRENVLLADLVVNKLLMRITEECERLARLARMSM